jgi:NADP-dependent 3-hydroxy acid dehydrogenase YdfG
VAAFYESVREAGHLPDILVCNAGQGIQEKLAEGDPEKWQFILNLNIMGALRLVRAFVPAMLSAGSGDVVFISSVAAGQAFAYGGVYAASKAALETLAETLRIETLPHIRVTTIAPGVTHTSFFHNTVSGHQSVESIGYGALAAEEVADAVVYALSRPPGVGVNHLTIRPRAQPF